jgi:hypothetical protein
MRTGIIALLIGFISTGIIMVFVKKKIQLITTKIILLTIALLTIIVSVFSSTILLSRLSINRVTIEERFTFDKLMTDFDTNSDGNLNQAVAYFHTVTNNDFSQLDIIWGKSAALTYIDSLYVNIILKYGIIIYLILFFILLKQGLFRIFIRQCTKSVLVLFISIFTFLVAIKGCFPIGNYYIFFIMLLFFIKRNFSLAPLKHK